MAAFYLWLKIWLGKEDGQDLIEYAAIIALILVAAIVGMSLVGTSIQHLWSGISAWVTSNLPIS